MSNVVAFVYTDGISTVATGSPLGHIAVWDLDKKRLATILRDSHNGSVSGLDFLQSQPLMVTSSPDNTYVFLLLLLIILG